MRHPLSRGSARRIADGDVPDVRAADPARTIFTLPPPAPAAPPPPAAPAPAVQPASAPAATQRIRVVPKKAALTDADIVASIRKGIDFLLTNFANGELDPRLDDNR